MCAGACARCAIHSCAFFSINREPDTRRPISLLAPPPELTLIAAHLPGVRDLHTRPAVSCVRSARCVRACWPVLRDSSRGPRLKYTRPPTQYRVTALLHGLAVLLRPSWLDPRSHTATTADVSQEPSELRELMGERGDDSRHTDSAACTSILCMYHRGVCYDP